MKKILSLMLFTCLTSMMLSCEPQTAEEIVKDKKQKAVSLESNIKYMWLDNLKLCVCKLHLGYGDLQTSGLTHVPDRICDNDRIISQ